MAFGMQGKNIRRHLLEITLSAMTRIFKRLKVHGLIEKILGSYKYLITALGKEIIAAELTKPSTAYSLFPASPLHRFMASLS